MALETERTLEQALERADELRAIPEWREDYSHAGDQDDLVLLADEVKRLQEECAKLISPRGRVGPTIKMKC